MQLQNNPGTECAEIESDGVYEYAQEVMALFLLRAVFEGSIKEGDGQEVITCWKFFLLIFKAANRTKYALEAATLLISLQVLPYRLQQQLTWSRFVNTRGQPAGNKPCNCTAKHALGQHFPFNPKSVSRVGRCIGLFQNAQQRFDSVTSVYHSGGKHCHLPATSDIARIIKQLVESEEVFIQKGSRFHRSFPNFMSGYRLTLKKYSTNTEHTKLIFNSR